MDLLPKLSQSDDEEEDLEALRLAALQSLKRRNANGATPVHMNKFHEKPMRFNRGKRGRFFGQHRVRNSNPIIRNNPNLIAITPIQDDSTIISQKVNSGNTGNSLVLPQDRYCNKEGKTVEEVSSSSKFSRYNDSDESESESEGEGAVILSEDESSPRKIERSNSLEALMEQLDAEIQGKSCEGVKENLEKGEENKTEKVVEDSCNKVPSKLSLDKISNKSESEIIVSEEIPKPKPVMEHPISTQAPAIKRRPTQLKRRKRPYIPNQVTYNQPGFQFPPIYPYNPPYIPPPVPVGLTIMPPVYSQPPPPANTFEIPLTITTDNLNSTLAPLSPRSAAFVLENRAIIEKRKRRSYSRSPSPRRRSRSPLSPRRRSMSPKRKSRSPRRRSLSPRRTSPIPRKPPLKTKSVRERLGMKPKEIEDVPVDIEPPVVSPKIDETSPVDPVLEARKKKFESNEIKIKEGVIRLKPKEDEEKPKEELDEELNEDILLEDELDLDAKVDELFSDEDSDSDNEGRFKTKQSPGPNNQPDKVAVLSFSKLVNGTKPQIKPEPLPNDGGVAPTNKRRRSTNKEKRNTKAQIEEPPTSRRRVVRSGRLSPKEKKFERKIEIKIKNPSKYEQGKLKKAEEKAARKVEVAKKKVVEEMVDSEPEIVEESDDNVEEVEDVSSVNDGDLRAQLSKKRAQRLHKYAPTEGVPTRLLQTALQGAVFKKTKKKKPKTSDVTNSDGKLPIRLRLGIVNNSEAIFTGDTKVRKKRKHKNTKRSEQV